ncbi:hypothetical protein [Kaarinaea lacus]
MGSTLYARTCRNLLIVQVNLSFLFIFTVLFLLPAQSFASSAIASAVAAACAPNPTVPDVGSCSACHSTTNNRGPNDLTAAGQWALSSATYMNFCPTTAPPPAPPPTPVPPPTTPPPGMSPTTPTPTPGMGGSGAGGDDDDDDGEGEADDDDDGGGSGALRSLRKRLSAFRTRFSRGN